MNAAADTAVKLVGVSRLYRQGASVVHALQYTNLEVRKGDFAVLVGPSDSDKTALLNAIGGLDSPTEGHVWVNGNEIGIPSKAALSDIRLHKIGFAFQEFNPIPVPSVLENAEFAMLSQGVPEMQRRDRAMILLKELGLEGMERRCPQQLSGGQQQRVAVARAIVAKPIIVLPDEPTADLDSKAGAALMGMMKAMNERRDVTLVFSTHDPMVVERARRVIRLRDGRIEASECRSS